MSDLPLSGIRVLDLSTLLAAPTACTLLGDFGADVIKVERPGTGDDARGFPPRVQRESLPWRVLGRNRRSVGIDLHVEEGREAVRRLGATCDVVVTNFRLETLRRWNLDWEDWSALDERLILFHLTAFGRTGPWRNRPGYARIAEAFAGFTHITGDEEGPPLFPGFPLGDGVGGIYGAFSIMVALTHRDQTGRGQLIDLALYEPMMRIMDDLYVGAAETGHSKGRHGNAQEHSCPNGLFPTKDGRWIVLPASGRNMWRRLVEVMGEPDLMEWDTTPKRVANREFIEGRVSSFTRQFDADDVLARLQANDVACGLVNTAADVLANEHVVERGNMHRVWDPVLERELTVQGVVPTMSEVPEPPLRPAPQPGEHTTEVLRDLLGYSEAELERLTDSGAI